MCVFWATCSFWNRSDSTAQDPCCEFRSMPVERMPPRTACSHMQSPFEHVSISFYIYISIIHGLISSLGIVYDPRNPSLRLRMLAHVWPISRLPNLHDLHYVLLTPRLLACSSVATSSGPRRRHADKWKSTSRRNIGGDPTHKGSHRLLFSTHQQTPVAWEPSCCDFSCLQSSDALELAHSALQLHLHSHLRRSRLH